jgi:hypothetical protein
MTKNIEREQSLKPVVIYGLAGAAAVVLVVGFSAFVIPQPAGALPAYATQTGLACGRCHVNPAGGGKRTAFGEAFLKNGHKLSGAKSGKAGGGKGASTAAPAVPAGPPIVVYDYAQAGAWSLRYPYYTHFLYSPSDYAR